MNPFNWIKGRVNVTIILKSGTSLKFTAKSLTATRDYDNNLTKLEWDSPSIDLLYIRLADISLITTSK